MVKKVAKPKSKPKPKRKATPKTKTQVQKTKTTIKTKSGGRAAEFGICYDSRGCPKGHEIAFSVTKNACDAANGKSWKGSVSGCVNL